jgi:putative spermidine/putrescine transport system permease protein
MTSFLALIALFPFVMLLLWGFTESWSWPNILPQSLSFRSWTYVFLQAPDTFLAIANSLTIALGVTVISLVLCIPAANALARWKFAGRRAIEIMLFAPLVIPPFIAVMGIHMTFIRLGLTDTIFGVMLAHIIPTLPYVLRALIVSYKTLGFQWEDQARMLGAGPFQRFWHVVIPHILPGIVAGGSLSILVSLSQYLLSFLVGGGQVVTLPLLLFPFLNGGDPAIGAVYSLLFVGMAFVSLLLMDQLLKYFINDRNKLAEVEQR